MNTHTAIRAISEYHTQVAILSSDEMFDLTTGGVYVLFFL